ncbi:MAG TPA: GNAT family N-acetyltransferase, partial [Planctomycetaceae bacterium]|nr:GNAT family N-acetyltransferase [Planctomycetaceae bacterium]
ADWNKLRHPEGDPFTEPGFIGAVEKSMARDGKFWHVIFRDAGGQPVASASFCTYKVDATLLAEEGVVKRIAGAIRRIAPWAVKLKVLFCGLPVSAGQSNLRFAPGVDRAAITRQLDRLLRKTAVRAFAHCIIYKEFPEADGAALGLEALGYMRADSLPMNHTDPQFKDFDDFLAHLKSSKRYTIRKQQKKFDKSGMRVVQMLGGEGADQVCTDDVHRLYLNVLDKAKVKLEQLPAEFFRELARQLPQQSAYTFVYQGDRVVAFACSIFSDDVFHQMFVGVDYELNAQWDLYFNLFYKAIDYAFRRQVRDIIVGQSADMFKQQRLNCFQVPLYFYIRGSNFISQLVIRTGFSALFPPHPLLAPEKEEGETQETIPPPAG